MRGGGHCKRGNDEEMRGEGNCIGGNVGGNEGGNEGGGNVGGMWVDDMYITIITIITTITIHHHYVYLLIEVLEHLCILPIIIPQPIVLIHSSIIVCLNGVGLGGGHGGLQYSCVWNAW